MKFKHFTRLTNVSAAQKLNHWAKQYMNGSPYNIEIVCDKTVGLGDGAIRYNDDIPDSISIGIYPLSMSFPERHYPISDSNFTIMGVTMFHELGHYKQAIADDTSKEIQVSDLSKCYNKTYYNAEHHRLLHEIDAEYIGVISMWSALESEYPDIADKLMFDYLDYRTAESGKTKKLYMIERPNSGFQSKQQVETLFAVAYEKSLTEKRILPTNFLNYEGDISRLLATDDGRSVRPEYAPVYLKLLKAETGKDTDYMMASLVVHIHSELQNRYTKLDFEKLEPR